MTSVEQSLNDAEIKSLNGVESVDDNAYKNYIEILNTFLNDIKRNKKAIISFNDYVFLIRSNTLNELTKTKYSIPKTTYENGKIEICKDTNGEIIYDYIAVNRVTIKYSWEIIENSVSIEGKMIDKIIQFFKPVSESIAQQESIKTLKISNENNR